MASALENLLVRLEADTRQLRSALKEGEKAVQGYEKAVNKHVGKSEARFQQLQANITRSLKGVGAAMAAAFSVDALRRGIDEIAELRNISEQSGLAVKSLQELQFAFRSAGVDSGRFNDIMRDFSERLGEARAQSGELYSFLSETGLTALRDQLAATSDTSEALDLAADAVARLRTAQERAALANALFGGSGKELIPVLKRGSQGLNEMREKFRILGLGIDEDGVEAADEARKAFAELAATLEGDVKKAITALLPEVNSLLKTFTEMNAAARTTGKLTNLDSMPIEEMEMRAAGLRAEIERLRKIAETPLSERNFLERFYVGLADAGRRAEELSVRLMILESELEIRRRQTEALPPAAVPKPAPQPGSDRLQFHPKIDTSAIEAVRALHMERLRLSGEMTKVIRLEHEKELQDFRELLAEKKISEADFAQVREDLNAIASAKVLEHLRAEQEAILQAIEPIRSVIENNLTQVLDDAFSGNMKSMKEYFAQLLAELAKAITMALVLKPLLAAAGNAVAPGLGSALGLIPMRAHGGPVLGSTPHLVGERGPELFVPNTSGAIVPNHRIGGSNNVTNIFSPNIDARGADIGVVQRIEKALAEANRRQKGAVAEIGHHTRRWPGRRVG